MSLNGKKKQKTNILMLCVTLILHGNIMIEYKGPDYIGRENIFFQ